MSTKLSILAKDPALQIEALKKSHLAKLVSDPENFNRICSAVTNLLTDPKLLECTEASIMGAIVKAATMGFRLERDFGEVHLIPRKVKSGKKDELGNDIFEQQCTFQIGYKGWKAVALQSGHIKVLQAHEVYKEDAFSFKYGTGAEIIHQPADENKGEMTHFYAYAMLASGGEVFEVITKQQAEKSRRHSESQYDWVGQSGQKTKVFSEKPKDIWAQHYAQMALRVPIKKLCAALPLTERIEEATRADGSITYMQADGTVTTISPASVEDMAEKAADETPAVPVAQLNKFLEVQDACGSMATMQELIKYFEEFAKSELGKDKVFVTLFFERAAALATEVHELGAFYNSNPAKFWHQTPDLIKILTDKKTKIEQNGKS